MLFVAAVLDLRFRTAVNVKLTLDGMMNIAVIVITTGLVQVVMYLLVPVIQNVILMIYVMVLLTLSALPVPSTPT